jgi:hypothetical protein
MQRMPAKVTLQPHTYTVLRKRRADMPLIDGEKPNGYVDADALEIGILKGLRLSKAQELLVHENLHPLWPQGFGFEEEIITQLAPRLLQWLQDNPELVQYLTGK